VSGSAVNDCKCRVSLSLCVSLSLSLSLCIKAVCVLHGGTVNGILCNILGATTTNPFLSVIYYSICSTQHRARTDRLKLEAYARGLSGAMTAYIAHMCQGLPACKAHMCQVVPRLHRPRPCIPSAPATSPSIPLTSPYSLAILAFVTRWFSGFE